MKLFCKISLWLIWVFVTLVSNSLIGSQYSKVDSLYNLLPDTVTSSDEYQQVERIMEGFFYQIDKQFKSSELTSPEIEDFINQLNRRFQSPEAISKIFNAVFWAENNSSDNYPKALGWYVYVSREELPFDEFISKSFYLLNHHEFKNTKQALRIRIILLHYLIHHHMHGEALSLLPMIKSENKRFNYLTDEENLFDEYANCYYNLKMFKEAILEWKKLIEILRNDENPYTSISLLNNIGLAYDQLGEVDTASECYQLALSKLDSSLVLKDPLQDNISFRNAILSNIARLNLSKGDYSNSLKTFKNSLDFAKENKLSLGSHYYNLAFCYHEMKEDEIALMYLDTLYNLEEYLNPNLLKNAYQLDLICAINAEQKDRAIHRNLKYNALMDSISQRNMRNQHITSIIKYKTEEKERELLKVQEKRNQMRSFLLLSLFASAIIILLVIQRVRGVKQKVTLAELKSSAQELKNDTLKSELEKKRKEIGTKLIYLIQKNEFISSITKRLKEINKNLNESGRKELYQIINELDSMSDTKIWSEFEVRFQEIHADFYNNITELYPNLTPNELKLCAFLKLNLSTKEISSITYQSPESIKTARYRLRKKLNLERETNLTSFLNSL